MKELNRQLNFAPLPCIDPKKTVVVVVDLPPNLYKNAGLAGTTASSDSPPSPKSSRMKLSRKRTFRKCDTTPEDLKEEEKEDEQELAKKSRPEEDEEFFGESCPKVRASSSAPPSFCYDSSPDLSISKYSLKVVSRVRSTDLAFRRIDSTYLTELIKSMGDAFYEQYILVDCRYPFEYDGGHIKGAVNLFDRDLLRPMFYPTSAEADVHNIRSKKPIFYCEFSSVRGPNMANALRKLDRQLNHDRYPYIDYNEIYVLSEGYRHFYKNTDAEACCEPPSYIPMNSKEHLKELRKYSFHLKSRAKLRRCISTFI